MSYTRIYTLLTTFYPWAVASPSSSPIQRPVSSVHCSASSVQRPAACLVQAVVDQEHPGRVEKIDLHVNPTGGGVHLAAGV